MTDDINFVCPRCGKTFTMSELIDHNGKALMDYINAQTKKELDKKQQELLDQARQEVAKEYEAKHQQAVSNFDKEKDQLVIKYNQQESELKMSNQKLINDLNNKIKELTSQYGNLQDSLKDKVELEKQQLINQYSKTINDNESLIKELKSSLETTKKELTAETVNAVQKKELELKDQFAKTVEAKDEEINELKIQNNLNRVINNKTKGENFEHEVEGELRKAFGMVDEVEKINDTINNHKADFLQTVMNSKKEQIGKIVYEVKNANWSDAWVPKLIQDCANNKTKYGVLIATSFSDRYHDVPFVKSTESDNIFICDPYSFVFVAQLLRRMVVLENEMKVQGEVLRNSNDNELLKQYETKMNAIKDFMISDLPNYQKTFNKQLESIDSVKRSLNNNENKLDTAMHMLRSKTEKLIFAKLEELTQVRLERTEEGED